MYVYLHIWIKIKFRKLFSIFFFTKIYFIILPLWLKIMIYSFWNPGHNSSKDKQSYLLIHRVEKTCVGEVTIQMLEYYRNLLEKRFFFQRLEETIQKTIHSLILFFHFFANLRVLCQTKAFKFQSFNLFSKGKMDNCLLSLIRYKKSLKEYVLFLLFNGMEKWS